MEVLFILIGFSLLVALFFLGCFFWAVKSGQYEDRYTPAIRILFEDRQFLGRSKTISREQQLEE
jgi:cbb3-type cytochrome oxidase maturation protein